MSYRNLLIVSMGLSLVACATTQEGDDGGTHGKAFLAAEAWRTQIPSSGTKKTFRPPQFTYRILKNGLKLYVSEFNPSGFPLVMVQLVSKGGISADSLAARGITHLTYQRTHLGGGSHVGLGFRSYLRQLSAYYGVDAGYDHGTLTLVGQPRHIERFIGLLYAIVTQPLDSEEWHSKYVGRLHDRIKEEVYNDPKSDALRHLMPTVFGLGHNYGGSEVGTSKTLKRAFYADVKKHFETIFHPKNSALVVVGDVSSKAVVRITKRVFGRWFSAGAPWRPSFRSRVKAPAEQVTLVHRKHMSQALVCIGQKVMARNHADTRAFQVANTIFGGQYQSRMQQTMREGGGYTYHGSSQVHWMYGASLFAACSKVEKSQAMRALKELLGEVDGMRSRPPGKADLKKAESYFSGQKVRSYQTLPQISSLAVQDFLGGPTSIRKAGMPNTEGSQTTEEQLKAITHQYFRSEQMKVLILGDAVELLTPLKSAKLGKVRVIW